MSSPLENIAIQFLEDLVFSSAALFFTYLFLKIRSDPAKTLLIAFICSTVRLVPYATWSKGTGGLPDLAVTSAATGFLAAALLTFFLLKPGAKKSFLAALTYGLLLLLATSIAATLTTQPLGLTQKTQTGYEQFVRYESDYMVHGNDSWRGYLLEKGLKEDRIESFPFKDGISVGETIKIIPSDKIVVGDIVFYRTVEPVTAVLDRVVGIVDVTDWKIASVDGTLGCMNEEEFDSTYLQPFKGCIENRTDCPYVLSNRESFRFYITKADNIPEVDQCLGIFPALGSQLEGKAVE